MYKVRKREGKIVPFDIKKITEAIIKAFEAEDKKYDEVISQAKKINFFKILKRSEGKSGKRYTGSEFV